MADRTYGFYDPLAQALDDAGERWALLVVRELLDGPRRYGALQQRLPGLSTARLADRLRELRTAGLIADGYALTEAGERLAPAIHALTRFGLARLRPLAGPATVYRPSFAAWALRARADAATPRPGEFLPVTPADSASPGPGAFPSVGRADAVTPGPGAFPSAGRADAVTPGPGEFLSVTHVEAESFCTRCDVGGHFVTWSGAPSGEPSDVAVTDTVTAMAMATGSWTLAQAQARGHLSFPKTMDAGRRWAAAHGIRVA